MVISLDLLLNTVSFTTAHILYIILKTLKGSKSIIIIIIIYFTQRSVTVFMHNDCDASCSLLN